MRLDLAEPSEERISRAAGRLNLVLNQIAHCARIGNDTRKTLDEFSKASIDAMFSMIEMFRDARELDDLACLFKEIYNRRTGP